VCDFCSHGASATGHSLVDPKYSRSKQSCRFATGNRHPCGTRGIRRCAQQISGAHDFGQQYLLRCDSKCRTSVYGGSDPHRLARTISATLSDGTVDALLDEIEEFLTGIRHGAEPDRILATVLFTDIVDSTKQAAEMGDRKWGELLQQHHVIVRRELARFRGREVNTAGDYFLIAFDGPGRAIRCGMSISRRVRSLGIDTVSRPSSRNSWSEGARVDENSRLNWIRTPPGAAQECAGIRDLADRAVT
jgi:adenylate/guanylate cyclase family protein